MSDAKPWWKSRVIIGGTIAIVAGGFGLSTADTAEIIRVVTDVGSCVGGVLAIYGRIKATRAITAKGL